MLSLTGKTVRISNISNVSHIKSLSEGRLIMRRCICLVMAITVLLMLVPGMSFCYAADSKAEVDWDYLIPFHEDRDLDTVSLHIMKKFSEVKGRSLYRGITVTRPYGDIFYENRLRESSAVGVGPTYMVRFERAHSAKFTTAFDISGGLILYDKTFPAGGKQYNFMWRVGPRFIYKIDDNSSVNVGYMAMHVSNGLQNDNPSYDAYGLSVGFTSKF